ncbi:MAG TPA: hypothetical protein DHV26_13060 [Cytophagales bacterium]|nr:hypothetical protein [Cytophagales bacterium]HRG07320.1 hypothetical protein [Cyclobacteriaceae bacterium]
MRNSIIFVVLIISLGCFTENREYTLQNVRGRITLKLKSDYSFTQIESLWNENDNLKYYGTWRYIDEKNEIIETTTYGEGVNIWTLTPKDTFMIQGDKLTERNNRKSGLNK